MILSALLVSFIVAHDRISDKDMARRLHEPEGRTILAVCVRSDRKVWGMRKSEGGSVKDVNDDRRGAPLCWSWAVRRRAGGKVGGRQPWSSLAAPPSSPGASLGAPNEQCEWESSGV